MLFLFLPSPIAVALILWAAASMAAQVGTASEYRPTTHKPAAAPLPPVAPPTVEPPKSLTAGQFRKALQQNGRLIALGAAAVILVFTGASCVLASDSCVRRRLNRNRCLPIGVDQSE
jgi:hypothetical protein